MSKILLQHNHYLLTLAPDITAICKPLFDYYGVNLFVFGRYFDDGSCYILSNSNTWLFHHLKSGYSAPAPIPQEILQTETEAFNIIPSDGPFLQAKHDLVTIFNTDKAVDLIYKGTHFYDVFCFSFPPHVSNAINIFLNNIEPFKKFCLFFKDKASKLIQQAELNKIKLPFDMQGVPSFNPVTMERSSHNIEHFYQKISVNKYHFSNYLGQFTFTRREIDCVKHLLNGYSARETAYLLNLSPRTVESHINKIKFKLGCKTKAQIISIFSKFEFL